ncbi:hypothetical protein L596_014384 [Steinernema carpocapsae]|uniref:Uncharacterized protein n=1 Tax=Steinernema carpocapsae TaxID=34508 RepID=A0A4U5NBZ6_STECR|nr:hypothetical protein L596_014384 [Steinernema carpocapsae]
MIPQSAASPHAPMAAPAAFAAPSGSANNDLSCTKVDCMKCKLMVINSFLENCHNCSDVINAKMIEDQFELNKMLGGHDDCSYYKEKNLNMPKIQLASVNNEENKKNEEIADRLLNILNESSMMRRKKRNSDVELKEKMLGMTTEIDCNYKRGEQISPQSPWSGLCSVCWQWRKLPLIYWPPYLNEVSCNSKDNDCLADAPFSRIRPLSSGNEQPQRPQTDRP